MVNIQIENRDWSAKQWPFTVVNRGSDELSDRPEDDEDLGKFWPMHNALPNVSQVYEAIPSGPNEGYAYLTDMPDLNVIGNVHVNYAVLQPPSAFLDLQTGPPNCTASQVTALIPDFERHEGLGLEQNSHSRAYRDTMWQLGGPAMEVVVGAGDAFFTALQQKFEEVMDAALASSVLIDATHRTPVPCNIVYFPS